MEVEANLGRKIAELPATALAYDAVSNTVPTKTTSDTQKFQRGDCNLAKVHGWSFQSHDLPSN